HDLVKLGHVSRYELGRVQTQACVDVRGAPRGDQPAGPGRVVLEAADVRAVTAARRPRVAGGLGEHGPPHRPEGAGARAPAARPSPGPGPARGAPAPTRHAPPASPA